MKGVILTMALIGSTATNMNAAFETTKDATRGVVSVYEAAHTVDPFADSATKAQQHAYLYQRAEKLGPLADRVMAVENPYQDELTVSHMNGKVFGYYSEAYSPKS